ncbi:aminotransferase class V-fold PLP-dependent enzyme [Fredinandcohnia sp. 179-A 10B2 NHS]|uniref:aminotransferase class V-fold PLP-dependent enzyme n=1 Tax=Fredinandcohnia sp. 179-A 10B2 NHS TaxID=3235176 RepID=UPI0039A1E858
MKFIYKIARTEDEFNKIHRLNYKTFVDEIPQHTENESKILVDKFHEENTYLICLEDEQLVGMIAVRGNRPYSLDYKLPNLEDYLPIKTSKPCEIRLLAVEKEYRNNGRVFFGLAQLMSNYCLNEGYDLALISGTTRQEKLYSQMGFKPFGPLLGSVDAAFQPMYLTKQTFNESLAGRILRDPVSFLPGPVLIQQEVTEAFIQKPISHRSNEFYFRMKQAREQLCSLTNSKYAEILIGTGTLANDVIAAQLSLLSGKGLILSNGEFGKRLIEHANRAGLHFTRLEKNWGVPILNSEVEEVLSKENFAWIWAVHCETSTGMLQDIEGLKKVAYKNNIKLCLDCISTIGAVKLDLHDIYFASGVSGKAIGSYNGLSFVFHNHEVLPNYTLPRYLDLGMYNKYESIPYTHSSNLLEALSLALQKYENDEYYGEIKSRYQTIRTKIEEIGLTILTNQEESSPAIMTVLLPETISSKDFGDDMAIQGYLLHYESYYLQEMKWLQIACIGKVEIKHINKMLSTFERLLNQYVRKGEPTI